MDAISKTLLDLEVAEKILERYLNGENVSQIELAFASDALQRAECQSERESMQEASATRLAWKYSAN